MRPPLRILSTTHPRLYELNCRFWLASLSRQHGRRIRLGDVTEADLAPIAELGFDLVWLMGVWTTGSIGRRIARSLQWVRDARATLLPDGSDADIVGSPFAVAGYQVADDLGGEAGLARLRARLRDLGIGLVLDFVPNHTAIDHPWVRLHPDWYVQGDASLKMAEPDAYFEIRAGGRRVLAHGRDPYFPAWTDTAQLDYRVPDVHRAMLKVLREIATRCDGIRCDMAMLVLDDVFRSTWAGRSVAPPIGEPLEGEFWWHAIRGARETYPRAVLVAEAYWDLEWRLQQLGFDYTYDKTLLDRLARGDGAGAVAHLRAEEDFQRHSVRFLENHDEPRAAAVFELPEHKAAALVAASVPGMLLVNDGQLEGARLRTPVQLRRRPTEPVNAELLAFYRALLEATSADILRTRCPVRVDPAPHWEGTGNGSVIARLWTASRASPRLAVANLSGRPAHVVVALNVPAFAGRTVRFDDQLARSRFERAGDEILARGLELDLGPYGHHLFKVSTSRR